jgi:hypothetical protein
MIITGNCTTREVFIDGVRLDEKKSQAVYNHSPDGFSWGYSGSGPAQLALALCLHITFGDMDSSLRMYQDFKRQFIASMPGGDFKVDGADMMRWIMDRLNIGESISHSVAQRNAIENARPS